MLGALVLAAAFVIDGGDAGAAPAAFNYARVASALQEIPMPPPAPVPVDPLNLSIAAGASVSSQSGSGANDVTPFVDVVADFPFTIGSGATAHAPVRIRLEGTFFGSPGQTVALNDISTFNAVAFGGGVHWTFGDSGTARTTLSVSGGVTSRLSSQALTKNPGHGEVCVGVWKKDHSASFNFCPVGFSNETGDAATVGRADGRVTIQNAIRLQLAVIVPYANAPSNYYVANTVHNVTALVALSADLDHVFSSKSN